MTTEENKNFKEIDGIISFLSYVIRWRMKELFALVAILLIGYILASNVSYDNKNGLQWKPSIKVDVEVKK